MNIQQLQELCKRLKANDPLLFSVDLEHENLGIEGASMLAEALQQNRIVNHVSIQLSNIGFKGTQKLVNALTGRGVRTHLYIQEDYSDEEYSTLLKMKQNSPSPNKETIEDATPQVSLTQENKQNRREK